MAKNKRGNGNGNGNGNNNGNDDDGDDGGGELFSDEQRSEIGNLVNAAVSGQLTRRLPSILSSAIDTAIAPLREQLERGGNGGGRRNANANTDDIADDDDEQPPQRGKGKRGGNASNNERAEDPEVVSMRKRLQKLEAEREQERTQSRNKDRDNLLREALTAAKVDPNRMRGAIAVLRDSMKYDEKSGEWSYRTKRDGVDEDLDIASGVSEWIGTEEGASFLASTSQPAPRGGSGTRPSNGTRTTGVINGGRPAADPKAAKSAARQEAMANLSNAMGELSGATIALK